jgi:glycosyltransferase involved in cell wall biosynthesis
MDITIIVPAYKIELYFNSFLLRLKKINDYIINKNITIELIFIHSFVADSVEEKLSILNNIKVIYKFYNQKLNPSQARNIGLKECTGKFIFFHDADDLISSNFIDAISEIKKMSEQKDIYIYNYKNIRESNNLVENINHNLIKEGEINGNYLVSYVKSYLLEPNKYTAFVHCWSKIFLRSFIIDNNIRFNENLDQLEDVNFNFNLLIKNPKIFYTKKSFYEYQIRQESSNLSKKSGDNPTVKIKQTIRALMAVKNYLLSIKENQYQVRNKIRHLYATTFILWIFRIVKNSNNFHNTIKDVKIYCHSKIVQSSMLCYRLQKNNSFIIPLLLKLKTPFWIILTVNLKEKFK